MQENSKGHRIMASGGISFAGSPFILAGYFGAPFSNRAFNLGLEAECRVIGVGRSPRSAASVLLNHVGKTPSPSPFRQIIYPTY
jgi:hypothetical protein